MRKVISLAIVLVLSWALFDDVLFAQKSDPPQEAESESKVIDLTADIVYPMTLNGNVEVMCLVGDFAAQHNGTIITADSAVRYNDKRIECFGNVLINKNTTYAYADRADYNGELNEANLYAPIVKVVDGDATLYCYNFRFNTLDNIGSYVGGGVMINGESVMESVVGYYYSDTKELIGVGDVELSGDEYQMKGDSIIYNTETENARYFDNTNIWNQKDEYLYADEGDYDKASDRYSFSLNGYILTEEQEMWSDSMDYYRASEHIYMRHNIQIDDTTQKSLIFGDYGEYIKTPGDMVLFGRPSIINYDAQQGDSLYMRADTFKIFTLNRFEDDTDLTTGSATQLAQQAQAKEEAHSHDDHAGHDHAGHDHSGDETSMPRDQRREGPPQRGGEGAPTRPDMQGGIDRDSFTPQGAPTGDGPRVGVGSQREERGHGADSLRHTGIERDSLADSLMRDSLQLDSLQLDSLQLDSLQLDSLAQAADTLKFLQRLQKNYKEALAKRSAERMKQQAARKVVLDSIGLERQKVINAKLDAEKVREARRIAERQLKASNKQIAKLRRDVARGKISADDTLAMISALAVDTAAIVNDLAPKRPATAPFGADSIARDSMALDSLAAPDSLAMDLEPVDSTYRLTKGYRNVKIYRTDFQALADSMVTSSIDSIIRLYLDPILWHDNNQVVSDVMDIYTANNQIDKAIFTEGSPLMASEIQPQVYYNQIAGKVITTLFEDGVAYRNDVDGNAQTIYFTQDDETQAVDGMMVMESVSATFYIEDQTVVGITYRGEPDYTLYPMNMIPADQSYTLKGFEWLGDLRPTRDIVFDREIRPTVREEKSELPRPTFPIQEELFEHRTELIESGQWLDRNDVVSPHAEAWMESLGYKTGQPRQE